MNDQTNKPATIKHNVKTNKETNTLAVDGKANVSLGDFDGNANTQLAFVGMRTLLRRSIAHVTVEGIEQGVRDFIAAVRDGSIFKRASSGLGAERFVNVLAAVTNQSVDAIKELVTRKQATLTEPEAFEKWIGAVSRKPEFKEKYAAMYPRKKREGAGRKSQSLGDLLA